MPAEDPLLEAISTVAVEREGRMTLRCADAFTLAGKLGVELPAITRVCNAHRIKIVQCQLGCFK